MQAWSGRAGSSVVVSHLSVGRAGTFCRRPVTPFLRPSRGGGRWGRTQRSAPAPANSLTKIAQKTGSYIPLLGMTLPWLSAADCSKQCLVGAQPRPACTSADEGGRTARSTVIHPSQVANQRSDRSHRSAQAHVVDKADFPRKAAEAEERSGNAAGAVERSGNAAEAGELAIFGSATTCCDRCRPA